MYELPDHPIVVAMERTGYPPGKIPVEVLCPVCDAEAERFYLSDDGDILGCDCCVTVRDAQECD